SGGRVAGLPARAAESARNPVAGEAELVAELADDGKIAVFRVLLRAVRGSCIGGVVPAPPLGYGVTGAGVQPRRDGRVPVQGLTPIGIYTSAATYNTGMTSLCPPWSRGYNAAMSNS